MDIFASHFVVVVRFLSVTYSKYAPVGDTPTPRTVHNSAVYKPNGCRISLLQSVFNGKANKRVFIWVKGDAPLRIFKAEP